MSSVVDLLVFDLDGTLIDSRRDLADSINVVLRGYGAEELPESEIGDMVGDGARKLVERAIARARLDVPIDEAHTRFLDEYDERLLAYTRPYEGVVDTLEMLRARGVRLAVLTNKPLDATRRILTAFELAHFFDDAVLGGDGPLPRKPDPAGLRELIAHAGSAPARTVMIGDSPIDLETARAAGTRACLCTYGFGCPQPAPELRAGERSIADFSGVIDLTGA